MVGHTPIRGPGPSRNLERRLRAEGRKRETRYRVVLHVHCCMCLHKQPEMSMYAAVLDSIV